MPDMAAFLADSFLSRSLSLFVFGPLMLIFNSQARTLWYKGDFGTFAEMYHHCNASDSEPGRFFSPSGKIKSIFAWAENGWVQPIIYVQCAQQTASLFLHSALPETITVYAAR